MFVFLFSIFPLSYKAYSTIDGKEGILKVIDISCWKEEMIQCLVSALKLVEQLPSSE